MPSKLKQLNVRLDEEGWRMLDELVSRMRQTLGIEVSRSDAVRAGLAKLLEHYPPQAKGRKVREGGE